MSHRIGRRSWLATCAGIAAFGLTRAAVAREPGSGGPITAIVPLRDQVLVAQESALILRDRATFAERNRYRLTLGKVERLIAERIDERGVRLTIVGGDPAERGVLMQVDLIDGQWLERWRIESSDDLLLDAVRDGEVRDGANGAWWTAGRDARLRRIDPNEPDSLSLLEGHSGPVTRLLSLDATRLVSASRDQSLRVWDLNSGKPVRELQQHVGGVVDLLRTDDAGERPQVVSLGLDRTVRLWQPTIGRMVRFVRLEAPGRCLIAGAKPLSVLVPTDDGRLVTLDLEAARQVDAIDLPSDEPTGAAIPRFTAVRDPFDGALWLGGPFGRLDRIDTGARE